MPEAVELDIMSTSTTQGSPPGSARGQFVTLTVVSRPRRQRGAVTLRRLLLRDPRYRRLARRGDRSLGGVMIVARYYSGPYWRRYRRRLIPRIGTEFTLRITTASRRELLSIASCVKGTVADRKVPADRGFGFITLSDPPPELVELFSDRSVDQPRAVRRMPTWDRPRSASTPEVPMKSTERLRVRFPEPAALNAALAAEAPATVALIGRERRFVALEMPIRAVAWQAKEDASFLSRLEQDYHAEIVPDIQYTWEHNWAESRPEFADDNAAQSDLDDVLTRIRAREAWAHSRGAGVAIAIIDSGVDGRHPEFSPERRLAEWTYDPDLDPWEDVKGHGTMCACIAAASRATAAGFDGVAPDAKLISCRTTFWSTEIEDIYAFLRETSKQLQIPIVANNSWGALSGTPPQPDPDINKALSEAVAEGIILVFSAGNNHSLIAKRKPCGPNSIWTHKSRANLLSVATCALDGQMWEYSSRGPGEWRGMPDCNDKPDVTAPTPANGRVLYGDRPRVLVNGWGTSGAAPQVAGLAALIKARWPELDHVGIFATIRRTAQSLGLPATCQGAGLIDCEAAVR